MTEIGSNGRRRVGIEKLTLYPGTASLSMELLANARDHDPKHPLEELLVTSRTVNPPWEDPVTMAVNAARSMLTEKDRADIELVIVGTESSPDFGKPISTYVQRYCELGPNVRNFETKHACYGGTGGLMMAAHWVASGVRPGKKALIVCADQSRTHLGKPWEYVLGAGASAMLVSEQPDVIEFDLEHNGYWTQEIFDTYRPTSNHEVGHADTSLYGYLDALEGAYDNFLERLGESADAFDYDAYFKKNVYHVPFGGMTYRAHKALLRKWKRIKTSEAKRHWEAKTKPSLVYNSQLGGTYTSATFVALAGLIDQCDDLTAGDRISMFSYGSGSCAEYYAATIGPRARAVLAEAKIQAKIDARQVLSVEEYERIEKVRSSYIDQPTYEVDKSGVEGLYDRVYAGEQRLVLDAVDDWERRYRLS